MYISRFGSIHHYILPGRHQTRVNKILISLEFDEDGKLYTRLYDKRDDFDFPIVNFPYLNRIFRNPLHMVFLFHSWSIMLGLWSNWTLFVAYVEWFVHKLWHMSGLLLFWVNRDGCHLCGRKCALFWKTIWGIHDFTHSLYTHYIHKLSVWDYMYVDVLCLRINDWLVCLD